MGNLQRKTIRKGLESVPQIYIYIFTSYRSSTSALPLKRGESDRVLSAVSRYGCHASASSSIYINDDPSARKLSEKSSGYDGSFPRE